MSTRPSESEPALSSFEEIAPANHAGLIPGMMFGIVLGTCLVLDAMANSPQVQDWIRAVSMAPGTLEKVDPAILHK